MNQSILMASSYLWDFFVSSGLTYVIASLWDILTKFGSLFAELRLELGRFFREITLINEKNLVHFNFLNWNIQITAYIFNWLGERVQFFFENFGAAASVITQRFLNNHSSFMVNVHINKYRWGNQFDYVFVSGIFKRFRLFKFFSFLAKLLHTILQLLILVKLFL